MLGVRPSCLRISPLLTLDSLEIGVQEIAERAIAYVVGGGASAQMSGEAVTQLFSPNFDMPINHQFHRLAERSCSGRLFNIS